MKRRGALCLVEEPVVEHHGHLGPGPGGFFEERLTVPKVLFRDIGLTLPRHQRFLQKQPLGSEREQRSCRLQTLLFPRQHEHRFGLPVENLVERSGYWHPECLPQHLGPLPRPRVESQRDIVVTEETGYVVALSDLAGPDEGDFHGGADPR